MKNFIAIDMGATSGRVILAGVEENGKVSMETIHRFPTPLIHKGDKYFWDLQNIFDNILTGLSEVGKRKIKVESIGVDTWGVDFVGVKADGSLCGNPRAYRDPYTFTAQKEFFGKMTAEELYSRTGIQIMNFNTVFQLYARIQAGELSEADKILFMPDAISYLLCGRKVCEYTILSTSATINPATRTLDNDILAVCGASKDLFPEMVYPGTTLAPLKREIAESTGLGPVPVKAVAGHDTASVIAAIPSRGKNFAYLSSGTWSLMGIELDKPIVDARTFAGNFTNEGGVNGTIRFLRNITGMWILEQCLSTLHSLGRDYTYTQIAGMAESCKPSAHLFNPDEKCFASPCDMPGMIAGYMKDRGWDAPEDDAHLFRLIYDSLAGRYAEVFALLKESAPFPIEALHVVGGGSRNDLLNRLTADACSVKVVAGPAEGTALGNVMVQASLTRSRIADSIETATYQYPNPNN